MTEPKNRLVQTRVPQKLERTLKHEAQRRRTTVSQMIRNILEDTFDLVDGVVANVDQIVTDSVELAQRVGRGRKFAAGSCREPLPKAGSRLAHVQAWNEVVLNRSVTCTKCGATLARGGRAYTGVGDVADEPRAWLCARAVESLELEDEPLEAGERS